MKSTTKKCFVGSALFCFSFAGCLSSPAQISTNFGDLSDTRPGTKFTYGLYYRRTELFNGTNFDGFTFCLRNELTDCTVSSGFVGIQSEGADFEVRKICLESLK
jgi:hypothetical protein